MDFSLVKYKCQFIIALGKSPQLFQHDLLQLYAKQTHKFSLPMNKIPEKFVPRYDIAHIFMYEYL